mgnify:CR=1 FL=1
MWPDSSEQSAKNLKNVALNQLRNILRDFEGLEIPSDGLLRLGGEGKVVSYQKSKLENSRFEIESPNIEAGAYKVVLMTPTLASPTSQKVIDNFIKVFSNVEHVIYDVISSDAALNLTINRQKKDITFTFQFELPCSKINLLTCLTKKRGFIVSYMPNQEEKEKMKEKKK